MPRKLLIAPNARRDIRGIAEGLKQFSENAAIRLTRAFESRFKLLCTTPLIGRDRCKLMQNLRSCVVDKYIVFFWSTATTLEILRVIHGARDVDQEFVEGT